MEEASLLKLNLPLSIFHLPFDWSIAQFEILNINGKWKMIIGKFMTNGAYVLTKDALLGEVAIDSPKAAELLAEYGLHCISCFANSFDTLELGAKVHGMDDDEVADMIDEINKELKKEHETK